MEVIGWIGMILLGFSFIPQIIKTYRIKNVEDISLAQWLLLVTGFICMLVYSISIDGAFPVVVNYAWALLTAAIFLVLYFKYKR